MALAMARERAGSCAISSCHSRCSWTVSPVASANSCCRSSSSPFQELSAGPTRLLAPVVIDHLDLRLLVGGGGLGDRRLGHGSLDRLEFAGGFGVLDRFEHDIALEQFADMRLQLESRHLEQTNGLLQLRRHGQLLTHSQLQGRFQHVSCTMGAGPFVRA